ncbi:hypothetical protein RND81_10G183700 [Saponaria officinalis]|uniref:Uncharacterized protein n=1 Tax=Saponaria officinalis TaxID=3572 RepID=A0AAW1I658_SAPOF
MKSVQSSENGPGGEPQNDEKNKVRERGGVVGEAQGCYEERVLKVMENSKDNNCRPTASIVHPLTDGHSHRARPLPQGQLVCWERFLPVRSLKVLLVESDDSTRHVVSALLRNCSYEVTAVSNGIEAWKILQNLDNQIDLVLTEVVMSGLSGIGLLSKIMTHKSCRNTPVIMMSCYDSMGIVLKCLSNGAADFLVKPIRKNELKNLWQHVWRRCHSSSGSGSGCGSGIGNEKSMTAKNADESDDDTGSNDEDDSRSFGLRVRDGSDNGSGTQSSWTKKAVEVDSPQPTSLRDQRADPPDSTCAQVISSRSEAFASSWVPAAMQECRGHDNQPDNVSMGKDLKIGILENTESQPTAPTITVLVSDTEENQSSQLDLNLKNGGNLDKKLEISTDKIKGDRRQAFNIPGDNVYINEPSSRSAQSGLPAVFPEPPINKDMFIENAQKLPSLELSMNRLDDCAEVSINVSEQNILRHSELSAFARYNACSTANQGMTGNVGSCSPADNSSEVARKPNSDSTPDQNSNSSNNNDDMGSTTRSLGKPASATGKGPEKSKLKCFHQVSTFQPAKKSPAFNSEFTESAKTNFRPDNVKLQENDMNSMTAKYGASLNSKGAQTQANAVNCSVNESVGRSNHGSNVHNGGKVALTAEGMSMVHSSGVAAYDYADNGSGSGSGSGVGIDQRRSAEREAALNKSRLKRKERCFDKKVRYQSRKKLAEQRPCVRGQFIRQVHDNIGDDDGDGDGDADS